MGTFLSTKIMKITKIISAVSLVTLGLTSATFASIDKNLKYGQRDKEVIELQEFLIDKGFLKTTPTNFFGILTLKAVKVYQKTTDISPTGYVGILTRQKINSEISSELASSTEAEIQETGTTTQIINPTTKSTTNIVTTTDYCKNIEGTQTVVPLGMFLDSTGNCFTPVSITQPTNTPTQSSNQATTQTSQNQPVNTVTTSQATTPTNTTQTVGTILTPILISPVSDTVTIIGGSSFNIATFNFKSSKGNINIQELHFTSNNIEAIESVTVGGKTASAVNGSITISDPSITVTEIGVNVTVSAKFTGFKNATNAGTLTSSAGPVYIILNRVKDNNGNINQVSVISNSVKLIATKPTVTKNTRPFELILGIENKIGEFTISADANGQVDLNSMTLGVMTNGLLSPEISSARVTDGTLSTILGSSVAGSSTLQISFSPKYEIPSGVLKTISVYATINGTKDISNNPIAMTGISPDSSFSWTDHITGETHSGTSGN